MKGRIQAGVAGGEKFEGDGDGGETRNREMRESWSMDRGMGKEDNRGNDARQKILGSQGRRVIHEMRGKLRMKLGRGRRGRRCTGGRREWRRGGNRWWEEEIQGRGGVAGKG